MFSYDNKIKLDSKNYKDDDKKNTIKKLIHFSKLDFNLLQDDYDKDHSFSTFTSYIRHLVFKGLKAKQGE